MANSEHVAIVRSGPVAIQQWMSRRAEGSFDLDSAVLAGMQLGAIKLPGQRICRADFRFSHLQEADFSCANLAQANFQGARLQGANLAQAYLQGAILREADLSGADLTRANLEGVNLYSTDFDGAILKGISPHMWARTLNLEFAKNLPYGLLSDAVAAGYPDRNRSA